MLDIKWIIANKEDFDASLVRRGLDPMSNTILELYEEKRQAELLMEHLRHAKNKNNEFLMVAKNKPTTAFEETKRNTEDINIKLRELETTLKQDTLLQAILQTTPNILASDVPYGTDSSMNKVIKTVGRPKDKDWVQPHFALRPDLMDFKQTAKMSGSRFVTLKGALARLERALMNFMIDTHTNAGFTEVSPPYLVRREAMYNVGLLPKFDEDSFTVGDMKLIPTGEVPLVNIAADTIFKEDELPKKLVAYTQCFRSEAGSAGKDTRGIIRLHQFGKVELVIISTPGESENMHQYILKAAEDILQKLHLPYRIVLLCTGDTGFTARKTYDLEVWMPAQKTYREISSCSNCGDFQAKRMRARFAPNTTAASKNKYLAVHTLNGSGLAVGRTLAALIENYQNPDGSISIPSVLVPYMGGVNII